jgi:predicted metalloprotease with PDZ domain
VDQAKLLKDCRFVSAAETDFFGGAPYHRYVWHFTVFPAPDGAGGLEHLSSTQIQLASGEGHRSQSVLAHEYFHLWNVKRIRSYPLGPFDYLTLPKTGALWWLEGVTDYYASLIPYRYREWTRPEFFEQIVSNVDSVRNNPAYNEVGASDSSLRVAEAEEGRGNSNGYKISYYNLGWLGGFCLDTELRARTNNHHSLDDVVHALYDLCKDSKPGFEEDEIRKQCIRFGGPEMGPYYDQVILKAGQMPIDGQLAKMGLKLVETEEKFADVGFKAMPMRNGARGLRVTSVSASAAGSLKPGDIITSLNGQSLTGDDMMVTFRAMTALQSKAEVGKTISVTFTREGKSTDATVTTVESTRKVRKIQEDPAASKAAIALREGWLKTKSPAVM